MTYKTKLTDIGEWKREHGYLSNEAVDFMTQSEVEELVRRDNELLTSIEREERYKRYLLTGDRGYSD